MDGRPTEGVPGVCLEIDPRAPERASQFNKIRGLSYLRYHNEAWYSLSSNVEEVLCAGEKGAKRE
ncbi:MAG: hypothetical protein MN733_18715 [Nitrososphaera sp.]|nr:hypothetical protein [Nitrososphaera sp.]